MIWDSLPELVKNHYRWENGELYCGKKSISNYYIKPVKWLKHPCGKPYIQLQYIIGKEEEAVTKIVDWQVSRELPVPDELMDYCVVFSGSAKRELLAMLRLQLSGLPTEGWYLDTIGWHRLDDGDEIADSDKLNDTEELTNAGKLVNIEKLAHANTAELANWIKDNQEEQEQKGFYGSFRRRYQWVYCTGRNVFPKELAESSKIVIAPELEKRFRIHNGTALSKRELLESVKELIFFRHPAVSACLLYLITGLLRSLFFSVNIPPKFLLYISGNTGTYKTTLANYFFDMYHRGHGVSFASADLTSSEAALQSIITQLKDCVFILDDLSKGVRMQETIRKENSVNHLIRTAANCEARYVKSGNQVLGEWIPCQIAITAEYTLDVESIMNRTVLVDLNRFPLTAKVLRFLSGTPFLLSSFAELFIEWSAENTEEICRYIWESWEGYRETLPDPADSPRLRDSIYILAISCGILMDCFYSYQIETENMDQIIWENLQILKDEEERQLQEMRPEAESYNMAEEIVKLINSKRTEVVSSALMKSRSADCWERDGYLYITPDSLLAALKSARKDENLTKNKISAFLKKKGLLKMDQSKDSTVKWNGIRYYKINCSALGEAAGIQIDMGLRR